MPFHQTDNQLFGNVRASIEQNRFFDALMFAQRIEHEDLRSISIERIERQWPSMVGFCESVDRSEKRSLAELAHVIRADLFHETSAPRQLVLWRILGVNTTYDIARQRNLWPFYIDSQHTQDHKTYIYQMIGKMIFSRLETHKPENTHTCTHTTP